MSCGPLGLLDVFNNNAPGGGSLPGGIFGGLIVFREEFTGNGSDNTFQLDGTLANALFSNGTWSASQIVITAPSHVTNIPEYQPIYDGIIPFVRNRINVTSISATGLVTLDNIPQSGEDFGIWYWYDLGPSDDLSDYYREDFVGEMEADFTDIDAKIATKQDKFDYIQTIYVGKHGNDSNDGFHSEDAKLTFTSAITAASALTPSSSNKISIICEDGGTYSENISIPSFVHISAPNATIGGNHVVADNSFLNCFSITESSCSITKSAGAGIAHVDIKEANIQNSSSTFGIVSGAGTLVFKCDSLTQAVRSGLVCTGIALVVDINVYTCDTAASDLGNFAVTAGSLITGRVGTIADVSGTRTTFNFAGTGQINLKVETIIVAKLFGGSAGTLSIIAGSITSTIASTGTVIHFIRVANEPHGFTALSNNAVATVNGGIGVFVKSNIATVSKLAVGVTISANRITHNLFRPVTYRITAKSTISLSVAALTQFLVQLRLDGTTPIADSIESSSLAANLSHREEISCSAIVTLSNGQFIEHWSANNTNGNNWIVRHLQLEMEIA